MASVSICLGARRKIQSEEASGNRQVRNLPARIWQSFNTISITSFWVLLTLICPSFKAFIKFETYSSILFASKMKYFFISVLVHSRCLQNANSQQDFLIFKMLLVQLCS